jgi:hypothetical protein
MPGGKKPRSIFKPGDNPALKGSLNFNTTYLILNEFSPINEKNTDFWHQ